MMLVVWTSRGVPRGRVIGVFRDRSDATWAIEALERAGFATIRVAVACGDRCDLARAILVEAGASGLTSIGRRRQKPPLEVQGQAALINATCERETWFPVGLFRQPVCRGHEGLWRSSLGRTMLHENDAGIRQALHGQDANAASES